MEKEFIPYEQALALKELGFEEECLDFYDDNKELFYNHENKEKIHIGDSVKASLYQQAFRWFREKYGYDVTIKKCTPSDYKFEIEQLFAEGDNHYFIDFVFKSHKEAELKCLNKLIETVKRKK